ncbi:unnamed protein product [Clonostachys rosea f. rosea IK726]|uniref:Uncharacterized protein n=2 Tax=Bionectria ochroleuca TaxID=29856 RepID=A0A0B7JPQ4_BIOOC|nr:unnamed protein product [Clonostachys rosea f. rosea IK726]
MASAAQSSNAHPGQAQAQAQAPSHGQNQDQQQQRPPGKKRRNHRGGKKKRQRRRSFAILDEDSNHSDADEPPRDGLYQIRSANLSGTSIDSQALLDHREHQPMRLRRASTVGPALSSGNLPSPLVTTPGGGRRRTLPNLNYSDDEDPMNNWDERTPLIAEPARRKDSYTGASSYGAGFSTSSRPRSREASSISSNARRGAAAFGARDRYHHVNNPPSIPGSPNFGAIDRIDMTLGDVMIRDEIDLHDDSPGHLSQDDDGITGGATLRDNRAEKDVCFPVSGMSENGDDDVQERDFGLKPRTRRRRGKWPDLSILEEWKHMEKEDRSEERRVKRITEPQLINGRLRPVRKGWFETDGDSPYRFTYFNEEFQSTIHSQTISELVQPGSGFEQLFIPEPRILSDGESSDEEEEALMSAKLHRPSGGVDGDSKIPSRQPSVAESRREQVVSPQQDIVSGSSGRVSPTNPKSLDQTAGRGSRHGSQQTSYESSRMPSLQPSQEPTQETSQQSSNDPEPKPKQIRYGERPVWWLNVLCPTEAEMKVISKAFGIHPLTAEDIMLQEAREKVELFRHYYFVNYRTFDQDINSENYLEPVNMYVVVFREGVLSFHFSVSPHPANVRRRIRQLRDYLILSSDWISYAIIDDITDVFQPLIQNIEDEVDEIDEAILRVHSVTDKRQHDEKRRDDASTVAESTGDMLRRVGDCRKRVMSLYRLLGNKADVIKGFAKRCNERWEVAPRSEIGLYLGDIQDHIVTMTSNLGHYEKILARSHANYLAQINIRMNERQEQTADVLGKLTVLGTIVLPMNIITGLWGMNVWVPGQEYEGDLTWFVCITAGLFMFGIGCYMIAKRVYKIV